MAFDWGHPIPQKYGVNPRCQPIYCRPEKKGQRYNSVEDRSLLEELKRGYLKQHCTCKPTANNVLISYD